MATAIKEATPGATPKVRKPRPAKAETQPKVDGGQLARDAAALFKQIGDATRVRILLTLEPGERHVGGICEEVGQSQPATSHHLANLRLGGLIVPRRDQKRNFYALTDTGRRLVAGIRAVVGGTGEG